MLYRRIRQAGFEDLTGFLVAFHIDIEYGLGRKVPIEQVDILRSHTSDWQLHGS